MYVSMHMCCEYGCSIARRTRRGERNGQMEARRHGWMDSVGRGERHLRFNLAVSLWKEGGRSCQPSNRTQPWGSKVVVNLAASKDW